MIDSQEKLTALLRRLDSFRSLSLDTEADSLHAYPAKVCLLQISVPGADVLVDPLAPVELDPLFNWLGSRHLILHGADYDLRMLYQGYGFVPEAVFDTMLAARLLGLTEFGLTHLVARYLQVALEKGPQKANWARRPLTPRMEEYARNDTRHLASLASLMTEALEQAGRRAWHQEMCAVLIRDCTRRVAEDPTQVWRVKGAQRLNRRGLAVLRELWHWRESEAIAANRPPFFILSHETLTALAETAAESASFHHLLPPRLSTRRRRMAADAVARGLSLPSSEWPERNFVKRRRASEAVLRRFESLKERRDRQASDLGLDPTLIASRAELSALAENEAEGASALMKWQRGLLGI